MYENEIYSDSESMNRSAGSSGYAAYNTASAGPANGEKGGKDGHKKGGVFRKIMLSISLGLCFGLFAGIGFYAVHAGVNQFFPQEKAQEEDTDRNSSNVAVSPANGSADRGMVTNISYVSGDVSAVVDQAMPAMVSIVNSYVQQGITFWGQSYSEPGEASGSGIIVAENEDELLIVTNYHVVEEADTLKVTFIDSTEAEAVIKGLDAEMDLAVIAVPLENLDSATLDAIAIAPLGDSDNLKLGEPVIAIGNALGYGQSVTNGIVSALDREITLSDGSTGVFIQTNAAINPGNSGGALLNLNGEVIGINSNKIGGSAVEGMGYAIPITSASPIIAELMERQTRTGKVDEDEIGYLGITLQNITDQYSQIYGIPQGVFVYSVEPGLAADNAGMVYGDIIVGFDGQRISSYTDLQNVMQYYKAGETVTVKVQRMVNGEYQTQELEVTLGKKE